MCSDSLDSSFYSIEEIALQAVRMGPEIFLHATENKFLSSYESS